MASLDLDTTEAAQKLATLIEQANLLHNILDEVGAMIITLGESAQKLGDAVERIRANGI